MRESKVQTRMVTYFEHKLSCRRVWIKNFRMVAMEHGPRVLTAAAPGVCVCVDPSTGLCRAV